MNYIFELDPGLIDKDETVTDFDGNELCPICGCCSLVEVEVVPGSIFVQAEQFRSGTPAAQGLICLSGCKEGLPHR